MKKLLLALALTMSLSATSAFADCGCPVKNDDCGCVKKPKCEKQCDKPDCAECAKMAKESFSDCRDQKREELYCRLNLDSCQRDQAMDIENKYENDLECIHDKIKSDHKCLCKTLGQSCLDKDAVKNNERVLKEDFKELKSKLKCMDKEFKSILRCEQKSEYRKIKREMKYRLKHAKKYCCKPKCNCED